MSYKPSFDENLDPNMEGFEAPLGVNGEPIIDDTLDEHAMSPEPEPVPSSPESVPSLPENPSSNNAEIEPSVLVDLNAKHGEQKWELGQQFEPDWHLDLNTRQVFNSKGESQTELFEKAGFGEQHRAMIDDLINKGSHELAPHQTDKEFIVTIVKLQTDGKITSETYKHAIEQEKKPEPVSKVEDETGDDDEITPVVAGYSTPVVTFSPEKSINTLELTPENTQTPTPAIAEARAAQPIIITEKQNQPVEGESFFQRMMTEIRAADAERKSAEVQVAIVESPMKNETEVVNFAPQETNVVVQKIITEHIAVAHAEAGPVEVKEAKVEISIDKNTKPILIEKTVDPTVAIPELIEKPEVVESAPDVQAPVLEVLKKTAEHEVKVEAATRVVDVEAVERGTEVVVLEKTETTVIRDNTKIESVQEVIENPIVETKSEEKVEIVVESTYEQVVAAETGISLEPENSVEIPIERKTETLVKPAVEILSAVEQREIEVRTEDIGIELIEVDQEVVQEAEVKAIALIVEEPSGVQKGIVQISHNESAIKPVEAVDFGIELVEEKDETVAETAVAHTKVIEEKNVLTAATPVLVEVIPEQKESSVQDMVGLVVVKENTAEAVQEDSKPEIFVPKKEDIVVQAEQKTVVETASVVVETKNVESEPVVLVKPVSIAKKIEQAEIIVKSESQPEKTTAKSQSESEVVKKNKVSEKAESVVVAGDEIATKARVESVAKVVTQKNDQELIAKRNPGATVFVNEDEEIEREKRDRELESFGVAFA